MVRYKNRYTTILALKYTRLFSFRYLLLEWKFSVREVGHKILRGENPRSILHFVREKIQAYHGEYGVACVQQSLSGEAIINRGGASEATLTGDAYTPTVTTVPIYAGHS